MLTTLRASKPGNLLSVIPCKAMGLRPQVEFRGKIKTQWALGAIQAADRPVALVDHLGQFVAKSATWPRA